MFNRAKLYVFTGTGNTLLIARAIARQLKNRGLPTTIHPLIHLTEIVPDSKMLVGIGFPVIMQTAYPFVWEIVRQMPNGQQTAVFMFDTMRAMGMGVVSPLGSLFEDKGYLPIGARQFIMPHNEVQLELGDWHRDWIIARSTRAARRYADALVDSRAHWRRVPFLPNLIMRAALGKKIQQKLAKLGRRFAVDDNLCTGCGTCANLCPVNNIEMADGRPMIGEHCVQCMRCASFCPEQAITRSFPRIMPYRAVELSDLQALEGRDANA